MIKQGKNFETMPHPKGWDFGSIDFEMCQIMNQNQDGADLMVYACAFKWVPIQFPYNYLEQNQLFIDKMMKNNQII